MIRRSLVTYLQTYGTEWPPNRGKLPRKTAWYIFNRLLDGLPTTNTLSQVDYPVSITIGPKSMNNEHQPGLRFIAWPTVCNVPQTICVLIIPICFAKRKFTFTYSVRPIDMCFVYSWSAMVYPRRFSYRLCILSSHHHLCLLSEHHHHLPRHLWHNWAIWVTWGQWCGCGWDTVWRGRIGRSKILHQARRRSGGLGPNYRKHCTGMWWQSLLQGGFGK